MSRYRILSGNYHRHLAGVEISLYAASLLKYGCLTASDEIRMVGIDVDNGYDELHSPSNACRCATDVSQSALLSFIRAGAYITS